MTRFDLEGIPAKKLYHDLRFLTANYTEALIDTVVGFANQDESLGDNALVTFMTHDTPVSPEMLVAVIYVNTQGHSNVTTAFDKMKDLPTVFDMPSVQTMAEAAAGSRYVTSVTRATVPLLTELRVAWSTLTFHNDPRILRRAVKIHADFVETLKRSIDADKYISYLFFQPLPSYMATIADRKGGNMLGLDSAHHNAILWTISLTIDVGEAALALAQAELDVLTAQIKEASRFYKGDMDFVYLNYADVSQDSLGTYSAANIQHMRKAAAKYDPTGVFQKRIPGGFKISRVA